MAHGSLDFIGLIPGVGEFADGANALWCLSESDYFRAGLSAGAMVPFAGWFATGGKAVNAVGDVATAANVGEDGLETVYRVYGGDSVAGGASWSPVNPGSVSNYRDAAGLPSGGASGATNSGRFVIEGKLVDPSKVVLQRNALPLDGMAGGIPEYIIPNWLESGAIRITHVSGVNPEF